MLCDFFAALETHAGVEHTPLILAGSVFLVPLRCWETRESWAEKHGAVLFSSEESRREGEQSSSLTCCPLIFARSLCPGTNSPGEPASLLNLNVLENWNDYQVAHLRGRQEPQGGESNRGQTRSPTTALTPGRAMEPHSEESTVTQRSPPQPETPDIWALTFRCRHGVFQDRGQARSPTSSQCPSVQSTRSGLSVLNVKSTLSLLNISVQTGLGEV